MDVSGKVPVVDSDDSLLEYHRGVRSAANLPRSNSDGFVVPAAINDFGLNSGVWVIAGLRSWKQAKEADRLGARDALDKPVPLDKVIGAAAGAATRESRVLRRIREPSYEGKSL